MIRVRINGLEYHVPQGMTILSACQHLGIYIPTLCHHPDLPPTGECGVCLVKVNSGYIAKSCITPVSDGMNIQTDLPDVKQQSLYNLQRFVKKPANLLAPEIEDIWMHLTGNNLLNNTSLPPQSNCSITWDPDKCVHCNLCIRGCQTMQQINAIDPDTHAMSKNCIKCGYCISVCPVHALSETKSISAVLQAFSSGKVVVLQTAPSVRVSLAELFGDPIGTICTGKIVAAAKKIGFHYVMDVNFGADVTILEEGTELIDRIVRNEIPMFTSCCPGWINYVETRHPELIPMLSTTKSPHMISGTLVKTYFAQNAHIDPSKLFVVSMMPCTSKKSEIIRQQQSGTVDAVLTVREFKELMDHFEIGWNDLIPQPYDVLGESTGGASIFGVTGGVMEAALRFAVEKITGTKLGPVEYTALRGFAGIKTATITINQLVINVAVCNGIGNAHDFINSGAYKSYHFIEVMACPGGCIAGGGQPFLKKSDSLQPRADSLYTIDRQLSAMNKVTSNDNMEALYMYRTFVGTPGCEHAHHLFHTSYSPQ